ncbi:unnamed protein product [Prunus armeniaca]
MGDKRPVFLLQIGLPVAMSSSKTCSGRTNEVVCMQVVITWPSPLLCLKLNKPCSFDIVQIHLWFSKASIHWGEKIGVVDGTGSGKSILIQVFFRLVEPSGGKIIIDGIDITTIGLHNIRSRFGIIPQEPVLFEGTVEETLIQ